MKCEAYTSVMSSLTSAAVSNTVSPSSKKILIKFEGEEETWNEMKWAA